MNNSINQSSGIVIQEISSEKIKLNVNGEVKEIQNQLAELKDLLGNLKVQNIQYAEKIYNIEHIDEANFGFVTGKKAFNEALTKRLMEALKPYNEVAQRFLERVATIPDWETQSRIGDKAKEIIAYSVVGVIGVQLGKLMAIGKEDFSEAKQRKYIQKCLNITKRSFDIVSFALISKCWDAQSTKQLEITTRQEELLRHCFDNTFEPSIQEQFDLLKALLGIFDNSQNSLSLPIPELKGFAAKMDDQSAFYEACSNLQLLNEKLDKSNFDLLDCFEAEKHLATFFEHFNFLGNYKMASIKRIHFEQMRNEEAKYLHHFSALGIDSKANVDAERINYAQETVPTEAVLLYRGEHYQDNINLFPFVIDYNAITFEQGTKICFFHSRDISDSNCLNYLVLDDDGILRLSFNDIAQKNIGLQAGLWTDADRSALNIDKVISQYSAASKALLPNQIDLDDF